MQENQNNDLLNQTIPLGFNVLCEVLIDDKEEMKSEGGIILGNSYADKIKHRGEILKVIKVGEDAFLNCYGNKGITPEIGAYCFVRQNSGYLLPISGKNYRFIPSENIIAIIPKEIAKELYLHFNNI